MARILHFPEFPCAYRLARNLPIPPAYLPGFVDSDVVPLTPKYEPEWFALFHHEKESADGQP